MSQATHPFPRFVWTPCAEPPTNCRRVLERKYPAEK